MTHYYNISLFIFCQLFFLYLGSFPWLSFLPTLSAWLIMQSGAIKMGTVLKIAAYEMRKNASSTPLVMSKVRADIIFCLRRRATDTESETISYFYNERRWAVLSPEAAGR